MPVLKPRDPDRAADERDDARPEPRVIPRTTCHNGHDETDGPEGGSDNNRPDTALA